MSFLLQSILLKRYSVIVNKEPTVPVNVIEKAVDLHSLKVIGSSGYQKCISYLWRGWLVQDEDDPSSFVDYKDRDNTLLIPHLDPDRMRTPMYQNAFQLIISLIYLALYTGAINTINPDGDLDFVEILLYIFTFGFIFEEFTKFYKAGYHILGFWNAFNNVLYSMLLVSLALRLVAFSHSWEDADWRIQYNRLSYNFLAFTAPMFWARLLLYLDVSSTTNSVSTAIFTNTFPVCPFLRRHACGTQSHDEREHHLLRSAHCCHSWLSPGKPSQVPDLGPY